MEVTIKAYRFFCRCFGSIYGDSFNTYIFRIGMYVMIYPQKPLDPMVFYKVVQWKCILWLV